MSNLITLLTNFQVSANSKFMFVENETFPLDPTVGQIAFVSGILYIYASIKGILTWYPLTNTKNSYIHVQGAASTEWTVDHQLGNSAFIFCVYDNNNNVIHANLKSVNNNNFVIDFSEAITGKCVAFFEESYANLAINENSYIRSFIGKDSEGSNAPSYSSTNYITNSDSLETAIGKLDASVKAVPYDISGTYLGSYVANDVILFFVGVNSFYIPANFEASRAVATVAATSSSVFTVYKNAVSIGTITFAAGATTGTFSNMSQTSFVAGDTLKITAPATIDSTLKNISISIAGKI